MIVAASTWSTVIAPSITLAAALVAVGSVGWAETRRLRSRHRYEERRKLQALIGRYRARLLEAAVDWDRRMEQLYASREELGEREPRASPDKLSSQEDFLNDSRFFGHPDPVLRTYGKFCDVLVIAFINQFGYEWQRHTRADVQRAVNNIVDSETIQGFTEAIDRPLGFTPGTARWGRRREPTPMETVRGLLEQWRPDSVLVPSSPNA